MVATESNPRSPEAGENLEPRVPQHVAIIMDGNRRYAEKNGRERIDGHRIGAKNVQEIVDFAASQGIKELTLWAFSTENWKRGKEQVGELFDVFREYFNSEDMNQLIEKGVQVRAVGRWKKFPEDIVESIEDVQKRSKNGTSITVNFALNYGGRAEIVDAVNKAPLWRRMTGRIREEHITNKTYLPDQPNPDLIIRTGGEIRTSGFQMWKGAYSEWEHTPTLWPDFGKEEFRDILQEFAGRQRRFGK